MSSVCCWLEPISWNEQCNLVRSDLGMFVSLFTSEKSLKVNKRNLLCLHGCNTNWTDHVSDLCLYKVVCCMLLVLNVFIFACTEPLYLCTHCSTVEVCVCVCVSVEQVFCVPSDGAMMVTHLWFVCIWECERRREGETYPQHIINHNKYMALHRNAAVQQCKLDNAGKTYWFQTSTW